MTPFHKELIDLFQGASRKDSGYFNIQTYLGTPRTVLGIPTADKATIAKAFRKNHPDLSYTDFIILLDELSKGSTFEERSFLCNIISQYKDFASRISPVDIDRLLSGLSGWCEIDSLCQSTFSAEFFLSRWNEWEQMFDSFTKSESVSKRRASLVLLCKPVRKNEDARLKERAFKHIRILQHEKDILITKAISWLLRGLIANHRQAVQDYIEKNADVLPKIAVRETRKKLLTGKKT